VALKILNEAFSPLLSRVTLNVIIGASKALLSFLLTSLHHDIDSLSNLFNIVRIDSQNASQSPVTSCKFAHNDASSLQLLFSTLNGDKLNLHDADAVPERGIKQEISSLPKCDSVNLMEIFFNHDKTAPILSINLLDEALQIIVLFVLVSTFGQ